jgi:hypothetical protein
MPWGFAVMAPNRGNQTERRPVLAEIVEEFHSGSCGPAKFTRVDRSEDEYFRGNVL